MGWTLQGYNSQGFNPSKRIFSAYWYVTSNGEDNYEIEKYNESQIDLGEWSNNLKIVYGTSSQEYFRGYVLTSDMELAKSLLQRFENLPVYAGKYGGVKEFSSQRMTLVIFSGVVFFFETEAKEYLGDPIAVDEIVKELIDELSFGLKYKFMENQFESIETAEHRFRDEIQSLPNSRKP